jgi:hypothetical protein
MTKKKIKTNIWYPVKNQSLAIYARDAGFDLAMYDKYKNQVQLELRARAVTVAMKAIELACLEKHGFTLSAVKTGIYVISLSNPLSIQYKKRRSQVIYIGRGNIYGRIKSHFEHKLFDFMLGLSGADFDFHFSRPALAGTPDYFKHVEHSMLEYFSETYEGMDTKRRFPILNINAGTFKGYSGGTEWWKKPLKAVGKRPLWELKPTDFSDFAPLDDGA